MAGSKQWLGNLFLRSPARLHRLRNVPVLGYMMHKLSRRLLPSDEMVWAQVRSGAAKGIWLELNPRTGGEYLEGSVEPAVQQALVENLRSGMVFYDLGANIGFFSLLAARLTGPEGMIFSFEPDSAVAARARRNAQKNSFTNVRVVNAGVWSRSGEFSFVPANDSSPDKGLGRIVPDEMPEGSTTIPCVAMDDFILREPAPNGIKCDVEGAEVEAFRGARNLLASHHPWIVCEIHSDAARRELDVLLKEAGYKTEALDSRHIFARG
ncbi:MAG: FkbM family methyltransferase [Candidatus Acidiferrales bacterium]